MKPVNSKSLFTFICDAIDGLSEGKITVEVAKAQSNLAKQANNILKYELSRAETEMKIREFNIKYSANIQLREVESKTFDNTI
jgi:hypothetical protein